MSEKLIPLTNNLVLSDTGHIGDFNKTIHHVLEGIGTQYSCASVAVGRGDKVLLKFCAGNRQDYSGEIFQNPDPKPVDPDTLYDMASVSKMMSTTMVALRMLEDGRVFIHDIDGNCFCISDPAKLDKASFKKIEIYM